MQSAPDQTNEDYSPMSELLQNALEGNEVALLDLAVYMGRKIYKTAIFEAPKCGLRWQQEDYDDFCQDMLKSLFENNLKKLHSIQNPSAFSGWLNVTVKMALIDKRRRRSENQRILTSSINENIGTGADEFSLENLLAGDYETPSEKLIYKELVEQVRRAVSETLSPMDQQILSLWGGRSYSLEEIGILVGMNTNTVGIRINRAKVKVLEHVKKQEEGAL